MENMILDAWNGLSYVEGVLFTFWLFILYYGKVWIDNRFEKKDVLDVVLNGDIDVTGINWTSYRFIRQIYT